MAMEEVPNPDAASVAANGGNGGGGGGGGGCSNSNSHNRTALSAQEMLSAINQLSRTLPGSQNVGETGSR